ncbi:hypothetical protein A4D02_33755 [Niastella koreensis]|uniref:Ankyrin n=2 Tax=Niastella koreensis TaxID=354356 RepID=G8TAJ7_NIAKG|nr:ankyrin repeat domain-containing protein [Niastella koreensis]AEV98159.1 Ankyrin [Niastella koreensis GR20-10]OQP45365.1 hypothetical protein A4D02_33755 [Niastella koreensis]
MTATNPFPIKKYEETKQEMIVARRAIEKEKAQWLTKRNALKQERATELDKQFKRAFERLDSYAARMNLTESQELLKTIRQLVEQGASASLLDDSELGPFNLADLIKGIPDLTDSPALELTKEIVRLTIIAGANLNTQKAYIGNGGAISLEWIVLYLAAGVETGIWLKNQEQYDTCYTLFSWIIDSFPRIPEEYSFHPFSIYLNCLIYLTAHAEIQEKLILAMISYGFSPIYRDDYYQNVSFFSRLATIQINWLFLLFPYEEEATKQYINALRPNITKEVATKLINAFTSNNKTRKHFKTFFSRRAHWLLRHIVESAPEVIFDLVKRNELDMLTPFLKNFKPALQALRNEKGNTLLHQAVLSRGLVENTIQLLRNSGLSLQIMNKDGLTPLSLAMKNNKTALVKLLQ